jgi:hypothetical protein
LEGRSGGVVKVTGKGKSKVLSGTAHKAPERGSRVIALLFL